MRRWFFPCALALSAFAVVELVSAEAEAGLALGADMNVGVTTTSAAAEFGGGVTARLGYRVDLGPLWVMPEVGGGYTRFGEGMTPTRVFGGGRVGLGTVVQPGVFGHMGYGWGSPTLGGPTMDMGAALDLKAAIVNAGVHVGVVTVSGEVPLTWVDMGMHAGLSF